MNYYVIVKKGDKNKADIKREELSLCLISYSLRSLSRTSIKSSYTSTGEPRI
jgi:hypothetical protein